MATQGLTEIQAVNLMLRKVNQNPVATLDASGVAGTSIQARAQEVLEEFTMTKLVAGLEENTVNIVLQLDLQVSAGAVSAISVSATPVITTGAAHGLSTSYGVQFFGVNSYPSLTGPYTLSSASGSSLTLTAGQITTAVAGGANGIWQSLSKISVPTNTLRLIPFGQDSFRTFAFDSVGNKLIDIDNQGSQFFTRPVTVRQIYQPGAFGGTGSSGSSAFEGLKPDTKLAIANEAAQIFQRVWRGSPEMDAWIEQERAKTEMVVSRPMQNRADQPVNITPITMVPPQRGQQEG